MSSLPDNVCVTMITVQRLTEVIMMFCQSLANNRWYPYQEEFARRVIESVLLNDGEEITALFSRQSGKSTTIAWTVVGMMVMLPGLQKLPYFEYVLPEQLFKTDKMTGRRIYRYANGFRIGIFAPALEQSTSTFEKCKQALTNDAAKVMLGDPEIALVIAESNGDTLGLSNGSLVRCQTASPNANIESKTYDFVIIDEAQDVETFKVRKSIQPMLASTNGTIVKIGTPNNKKSDFYEAMTRNRKRDRMPGAKQNHFEFDWRYCAKWNDDYARYVETEKKKYGEKSDEFRMAYLLHWIMERGMFCTHDQLCGTPEDRFSGLGQDYDLVEFQRKGRHVCGIDVAKSPDSTVVWILDVDYDHPEIIEEKIIGTGELVVYKQFPKKVIAVMELLGDGYETQYGRITSFINGFSVERVIIDSTNGNGDYLKDRLSIYYHQIPVEGFKFTTQTKSELYKNFMIEMTAARIIFPWSQRMEEESVELRRFIYQTENLEKKYNGQYLVVAHPDGKDQHDDYPDALALACWAAREDFEEYGVVQMEANPIYGRAARHSRGRRR
jgi:hypothetical protein